MSDHRHARALLINATRLLTALVTSGLIATATANAAPPSTKPLARFQIEAQDRDYRDTPITIALPPTPPAAENAAAAELPADQPLEIGTANAWWPVTRDPDNQGHFVLPALKKGKRLTVTLRPARPAGASATTAGARAVAVDKDDEGVWITVGGKRLLRYQAKARAPEGIRPDFLRGGYLHPVLTPSGVTVTDDYPADHKHHHGIWTAWTHTEYEGRTPDFWNMGQKKARKDHTALGETFTGRDAGGFIARLSSTDLQANPARVVIDERWKVVAYRLPPARSGGASRAYHLFDLEWTDTVLGKSPLKLPEYRYGGLGVRGHIGWLGEEKTSFLTSEGKDRKSAENTPARWCHMGGLVAGKAAGIAALDHPTNFRHPQPLRISPNQPYFVYSPMKAGPFVIEAGKPFVSRYRFVVTDGPADPALLERLWQDFATPPTVTALPAP